MPLGVSGKASSDVTIDGHHVRGQLARQVRGAARAPATGPPDGDDVGDQLGLGVASPRATTDGLADARMAGEHGLDLAELDAEAADLDLVVDAAEELELPVRAVAGEVAVR